MLKNISNYLAEKTADPAKDNVEILTYGYELALSTLMTALLILCIAMTTGEIMLGLVFIASYAPIRVCAGGYHAKTFIGCNIVSGLTFVIVLAIYKLGELFFRDTIWQCTLLFSTAIILIYAPHENENHPLSPEKHQKNRKNLVVRLMIELVIIQILLLHGFTQVYIAILGLCLVAILLIISIIMEGKKNDSFVKTN